MCVRSCEAERTQSYPARLLTPDATLSLRFETLTCMLERNCAGMKYETSRTPARTNSKPAPSTHSLAHSVHPAHAQPTANVQHLARPLTFLPIYSHITRACICAIWCKKFYVYPKLRMFPSSLRPVNSCYCPQIVRLQCSEAGLGCKHLLLAFSSGGKFLFLCILWHFR